VEKQDPVPQISNFLTLALNEQIPRVGLWFCRLANERTAQEIHYTLTGRYPDEEGYTSFSTIIKEIESEISSSNRSKLWKVADLTNKAAHIASKNEYSFTQKQVEGTVKNILSVYRDFFGRELDLSGEIDRESAEDSLSRGIDKDLQEMGIPQTPGREFFKLGIAADLGGRPFAAEGYFREAIEKFRDEGEKKGESFALNSLALVSETRGTTMRPLNTSKRHFKSILN
jgi:hypothetical protein